MIDASTRTIARIKLDEMQRQRDRLHNHYASLEQRVAQAATPLERLRLLHDGLRQVQFAQKPFHPDVANLDAVFFEAEAGAASAELVASWVRQLERELARGRLRAEFAYVFGRLLDEWSRATPAAEDPAVPDEEHWQIFWQPEPPLDLSLLAHLFEQHAAVFRGLRDGIRAYADKEAQAPATVEEVYALLSVIAADTFAPAERRRQAAVARSSQTHLSEYAGVLTVLLNNLSDWQWPVEGVALRPLWKFGKWRPHLEEDLVNGLFLQLVGLRWGMKIKQLLNIPLTDGKGLFPRDTNSWHANVDHQRQWQASRLFLQRVPDRLETMAKGDGYGSGGYQGRRRGPVDQLTPLEQLLVLVNAELRFRRVAFPDQPLQVVHADLRDYYPSIPHPVLSALVDHLGFPAAWQDFFRKYFAVPLQTAQGPKPIARGLLLEHLLAAVFADVLLLLLDVHIYRASGLRTLRAIDDIYLVSESPQHTTKAWTALKEFCAACGLAVNEPKSGAVAVGGQRAVGLPEGLPRWGLLRLHEDGLWHLDEEALAKQDEQLREQVQAAPSVLALVARYNDHIGYLQKNLGLPVWLDGDHLSRAGRRLARTHQQLLGDNHGVADEIRRRLNERLVDPRLQERDGLAGSAVLLANHGRRPGSDAAADRRHVAATQPSGAARAGGANIEGGFLAGANGLAAVLPGAICHASAAQADDNAGAGEPAQRLHPARQRGGWPQAEGAGRLLAVGRLHLRSRPAGVAGHLPLSADGTGAAAIDPGAPRHHGGAGRRLRRHRARPASDVQPAPGRPG